MTFRDEAHKFPAMTGRIDAQPVADGFAAQVCVRIAAWSVRNRAGVIMVSLALLLAGLAGALTLTFNPDARVYFSTTNPERVAYEALNARYGTQRDLIALVQAGTGGDDASLRAAGKRAMAAIGALDGVMDVGAALPGQDEGLTIHDGSGAPVGVFNIAIAAQGADAYLVVEAVQAAGDTALAGSGHGLLLTGEPAQEAAAMNAIRNDLAVLVPIEVVLIIALLLAALGSLAATGALLCVLAVATAATMGFYGWTGAALNGVTSVVPSVLLGLSVATSVHVILGWQHGLRDGLERHEALLDSVRINASPIVLATVTTIISFACLNFADSPAFHAFGTLVACGLILTLVLSFTLLPAVISLIPANPVSARKRLETAMGRLGHWVCRWRIALLVLTVLVASLAAWGTSKVVFRDTFTAYFDESYDFRRATLIYEDRVGGITAVEFSVAMAPGETFTTPSYAGDVATFAQWLEGQPKVTQVTAVTDLLKAGGVAYGLTDDNGVPTSDGSADLLRDGLAGRSDEASLQRLLGTGFSDEAAGEGATRVIAVLQSAGSDEILAFAEAAEARLREIGAARAATATGMPVLAAHLSQRNGAAMVKATPVALAAISLLLIFALGSVRLGFASLVPNLMPLLMAYGAWGLLMGELTFAGTMVVAMTFGIVVDDTVHMMSRYRYLRARGVQPRAAMESTFRTVGIAVVTTTVAILSGFSVLSFSAFVVNRDLGLITVATLASALIATLFFLPPLLLVLERRRRAGAGADTGALHDGTNS